MVFNWKQYLINYPDLRKAGITFEQQALKHYQRYGTSENRTDRPIRYNLKISKLPKEQLKIKKHDPGIVPGTSVDLRSKLPACYNQGNLGSCTANAMVGAYQFIHPSFMGSRLFLYYNERLIEGTPGKDTGAYIHDGISSLEKTGLCLESAWPYIISKFAVKPSAI